MCSQMVGGLVREIGVPKKLVRAARIFCQIGEIQWEPKGGGVEYRVLTPFLCVVSWNGNGGRRRKEAFSEVGNFEGSSACFKECSSNPKCLP